VANDAFSSDIVGLFRRVTIDASVDLRVPSESEVVSNNGTVPKTQWDSSSCEDPSASFFVCTDGSARYEEGMLLINLDLLVSADCELGEPPSIHLVFGRGRTRSYRDAACLAIFRELTGRPNIVELSRSSGADLIDLSFASLSLC
jgi:hypothetical protein